MRSTDGSLLRDGQFARYWLAQTISIVGTFVTMVAMPILVFDRTGSAFLTASIAALETVPYLLFGLFAGVAADRVDRRRLMIACDIASTADIVIVNGINVRLLLSPDALRGRVGTTGRMVSWGGQPFGALLGAGWPARSASVRRCWSCVRSRRSRPNSHGSPHSETPTWSRHPRSAEILRLRPLSGRVVT